MQGKTCRWEKKRGFWFSPWNLPSVSGNFPGLEKVSFSRTLGPPTDLHPRSPQVGGSEG